MESGRDTKLGLQKVSAPMSAEFPHVELSDRDAAAVVTRWVDFVNAADVESVCGLYNEGAVLLPTFSPHALITPEQRRNYFISLVSRDGLQVSLHEKTLRVCGMAEAIKIASGIYRFCFDVDEESLTFEARFSYVMDLSREQPIRQHHSSQVPRTLA